MRGSTFQIPWQFGALDSYLGARIPHLSMKRALWTLATSFLLVAVAWDFAAATTFLGDDYLFRALARLEANPLVAFVSDQHGGE